MLKEAIGSMLEETDRLARLVDNLLTLSRGDFGRARVDLRSLNLGALAREVVEELRILAEEKNQSCPWTVHRRSRYRLMSPPSGGP